MGNLIEFLCGSVSLSDFVFITAGAGLQQAAVARSINIGYQAALLALVVAAVVGIILAMRNVQRVWDLADCSFRGVGGVVSVFAGFSGPLAFAVLWENPNSVGLRFFVAVMLPTFGMIFSKNWALRLAKLVRADSYVSQNRPLHRLNSLVFR